MTSDDLPEIFRQTTPTSTDAEALTRKAADMLADLADQYPTWTQTELTAMRDFLDQAATADTATRFTLIRENFFRKAHDIKGQGATFNYPLMTDVGSFVCDYLRHKEAFTDQDIALMRDMVALMQTILTDRLTGDGGTTGQAIRRQIGKEAK